MTVEDVEDADLTRKIAEALHAQKAADRQAAADASEKLEIDRGRTLTELSREAQSRQAADAAERHQAQEEQSRRYVEWLEYVQPEVDKILEEIAGLAAEEHAERERSAAVLTPLSKRKIELARQIAALQQQPADDFSPERVTPRDRLRALVGLAADG